MYQNLRMQELKCKKWKQHHKITYTKYHYTKKEWILYGAEGIVLVLLLTYFFYRSFWGIGICSPLWIIFLNYKKDDLCKKRKQKLGQQFKDVLVSINGSLQAGYSMENAVLEAYQEMTQYHGKESIVVKELAMMKGGIGNSQPIEELFRELGERSGIEEIRDFGNVIQIGKHSGGDLNEIVRSNISVIEEKMDTKQEIQTILSAKKLETGIMSVIPLFIILYMELTSHGYFDVLYRTFAGNILMTICLAVYLSAIAFSKKITEIEV